VIVVDASAIVEVLLGSPRGSLVSDALRGATLATPAHFDAEAYRALRRLRHRGHISSDDLGTRLRALSRLAIERIALPPLLLRASSLGDRFSPPDSLYVALARALGGELLTCDAPLAKACEGVVPVRLVEV
jgi:predicted nucleic acid-binding protein